jgi:hypothetical protein
LPCSSNIGLVRISPAVVPGTATPPFSNENTKKPFPVKVEANVEVPDI